MNRRIRTLLIVGVLASFSQALFSQVLGSTLATVRLTETEMVTAAELTQQIQLLERQMQTSLTNDQKNEILQSQINSILISQAARRANLSATEQEIENAIQAQKQNLGVQVSDSDFQRMITEQTGISWARFREQIENRILQEKYLSYAYPNLQNRITRPTEEEIQQVYDENAQSFLSPQMSGVSHIFMQTRGMSDAQKAAARTKMEEFARRIRNGGSAEFDAIVRESLDDASFTGGELGYVRMNDQAAVQSLGQRFIQQVLSMEQGQISQVLDSTAGLHIVRIDDRRRPRLLGLDDPLFPGQSLTVRQNVTQYILNQRQQQVLLEVLNETFDTLRDEAEIRIFEDNLPW